MNEEYEEISVIETVWAQERVQEISDKCRSCTTPLSDIRYNILKTPSLIELYVRLSATRLDPDDPLPKCICPDCFQQLQDVISFQVKCNESYTTLLEHILVNDVTPKILDTELNSESCTTSWEHTVNDVKPEISDIELNSAVDTEDIPSDSTSLLEFVQKIASNIKCEEDVILDDEIVLVNEYNLPEHEVKKFYKCPKCPREYTFLPKLKQHILFIHTRPTKLTCKVEGCNRKYPTQQQLQNHISLFHTKSRPIKRIGRVLCKICGNDFSVNHVRAHELLHNGKVFPFACDQCPRKFPLSNELATHIQQLHSKPIQHPKPIQHSEPIQHSKDIKATKENPRQSLRKKHVPQKKFACQYCGSLFCQKDGLTRHVEIIHKGIKKYKCTYCDKVFGQKTSLRFHIMVHTGEQPFQCTLCDKRFRRKSILNEHIRAHGTKRRFRGSQLLTNLVKFENKKKNVYRIFCFIHKILI